MIFYLKNFFLITIISIVSYVIHIFLGYHLIQLTNSSFGDNYLGFTFYWGGFIALFFSYFVGGYFLRRIGVFNRNSFVCAYAVVSSLLIILTLKVKIYDSSNTILVLSSYIQFFAPFLASLFFFRKIN